MITINLDKAKQIAHEHRRSARAKEFEPLDALITKQIPGVNFSEIESQRQAIREKYASIQQQIDDSTSIDELQTFDIYKT